MAAELRTHMNQAARQLALRHTFARNVDEILSLYAPLAHCRAA